MENTDLPSQHSGGSSGGITWLRLHGDTERHCLRKQKNRGQQGSTARLCPLKMSPSNQQKEILRPWLQSHHSFTSRAADTYQEEAGLLQVRKCHSSLWEVRNGRLREPLWKDKDRISTSTQPIIQFHNAQGSRWIRTNHTAYSFDF